MLTKVSASEDGSESVVCFNSAWNPSVSFRVESLLVRGGGSENGQFLSISDQGSVFGVRFLTSSDCRLCNMF